MTHLLEGLYFKRNNDMQVGGCFLSNIFDIFAVSFACIHIIMRKTDV